MQVNELTAAKKQPQIASFNKRAIMPSQIGGLLVAVGGGLLFSTLDKEPPEPTGISSNSMEQWGKDMEKFNDGIITTHKIGYGCIIIGGLLVAAGDKFANKDDLPEGFNAD